MADITTIFKFEDYHIRGGCYNGREVWLASDICQALGIKNTKLRGLADDEKGVILNDTFEGKQLFVAVYELGIYHLLDSARKEIRQKFRCWLNREVIPEIRRLGKGLFIRDPF